MNCTFCDNNIPPSVSRCPHCAQPSLFPNVTDALREQSFLQERYNEAINEALSRRAAANVEDFEKKLSESCAVINRSLSELLRLTTSELDGYATYYQLASSSLKTQSGEKWDARRQAADEIFFANYQHEIRFAALSLTSGGLTNYGECSWVFRENMISHRTSLFRENTTMYYLREDIKDTDSIPRGFRAVWEDRAKLCIVKLAQNIDTTTTSAEYSNILMHQGAATDDDEFVEVHIFGPMTILTIEEVTFNPVENTTSDVEKLMKLAMIVGIKEKLGKYGVKVS